MLKCLFFPFGGRDAIGRSIRRETDQMLRTFIGLMFPYMKGLEDEMTSLLNYYITMSYYVSFTRD